MGVAAGGPASGDASVTRIIANIFISFIGAGVLGLPYAFKVAGMLEVKHYNFLISNKLLIS